MIDPALLDRLTWMEGEFTITKTDAKDYREELHPRGEHGRWAAIGTGTDTVTIDGKPTTVRNKFGLRHDILQSTYDLRARAQIDRAPTTAAMTTIAESLGGHLAPTGEALKSQSRIEEKVARDAAAREKALETGDLQAAALAHVGDSLRYTMVFPTQQYTERTITAARAIQAAGFPFAQEHGEAMWRPTWHDPIYKGVNANFVTPGGLRFEMQFHTDASLDLKTATGPGSLHNLYADNQRTPSLANENAMAALTATVISPPGAADLVNQPVPSIDTKGDVAGHAFHGNRFTGGIGGGETKGDGRSKRLTAALAKLETDPHFQNSAYEHLQAFTPNGARIFKPGPPPQNDRWTHARPSEFGISSDHATTVQMTAVQRTACAGAIVTHNHPDQEAAGRLHPELGGRTIGGTLSNADIAFASLNGVAEMRAVDEKYTYSMRPPEGQATFSPLTYEQKQTMADNQDKASLMYQAIQKGQPGGGAVLTGESARILGYAPVAADHVLEFHHEEWVAFAEKYGYRYDRIEHPKSVKGDVAGHAFHGNRFTGGLGGDGSTGYDTGGKVYVAEGALSRRGLDGGAITEPAADALLKQIAAEQPGWPYLTHATFIPAASASIHGFPSDFRGSTSSSGRVYINADSGPTKLDVVHEAAHVLGLQNAPEEHGKVWAERAATLYGKYIGSETEVAFRELMSLRPMDVKGDVAGHAFHGNRFTGGIGGGTTIVATPTETMIDGRSAALTAALAKLEENPEYNHSPVEIMQGFKADGKPVFSKLSRATNGRVTKLGFTTSSATQVRIGPERAMALSGSTITHCHPDGLGANTDNAILGGRSLGSTLSVGDIAFASNIHAAEIRAVDAKYVYSMRPPEGQPTFHQLSRSQTERLIDDHNTAVQLSGGTGTAVMDAYLENRHLQMAKFAEDNQYRYSRTEHK